MDPFIYNAHPARVIFGSSTLEKLPDELSRLEIRYPMVIVSDRQLAQSRALQKLLNENTINHACIFKDATQHTPKHVTQKAMAHLKESGADGVLSVGGGSAIGLGKALALNTNVRHICVPTTYAGSEMTAVLGQTEEGRKTTITDPRVLPQTVLYDVDLTFSMAPELSACSGVNAIAHAGT
jgi:alcohol dehydrogenase class IV